MSKHRRRVSDTCTAGKAAWILRAVASFFGPSGLLRRRMSQKTTAATTSNLTPPLSSCSSYCCCRHCHCRCHCHCHCYCNENHITCNALNGAIRHSCRASRIDSRTEQRTEPSCCCRPAPSTAAWSSEHMDILTTLLRLTLTR